MESGNQSVRIQVCEKCFEHATIDPHSETLFQQAFEKIDDICSSIDLKIIKNSPFRYLRKLKDSKISSKRFLDTNQNRIVQFPRRSAFQIYYLNILIFSRLRSLKFPDYQLLKIILERIKNVSIQDPLMKGFGIFRNLELEWKHPTQKLDCLYEYVKLCIQGESPQQKVQEAFKKLMSCQKQLESQRKKIILPYSIYGGKQKQCKMRSIYCPNVLNTMREKQAKTHRNVPSKLGSYIRSNNLNEKHQNKKQSSPQKYFGNSNKLFDLVRIGGSKMINPQKFSSAVNNLSNHDFEKVDMRSKNIYFSYLNRVKQNKVRDIKTATTRRQPNKCLFSAGINKISINHSSSTGLIQNNKTLRKSGSQISNNLPDQTLQIHLKNSQLEWKDQIEVFDTQNQQIKSSQRQKDKISELIIQEKQQLLEITSKEIQKQPSKSFHQIQKVAKMLEDQDQILIPNYLFASPRSIERKTYRHSGSNENKQSLLLQKKRLAQRIELKWVQFQKTFNYRQSANVTKRFSSPQNFNIDFVNKVYQSPLEQLNNKYRRHIDFKIEGEQLTFKIQQKSLRTMFYPRDLKLFPEIFDLIKDHSTILTEVVNTLLVSNPILISRIFENKKSINPYGFYCIWLKSLNGNYQPIFVDDQVAVYDDNQSESSQNKRKSNLVYSKLNNENSIWFIILEKAIAKVLGGYHNIAAANISTLLNILVGYPTVSFSSLNIQKTLKIFQQKNFFNKLATFYARRFTLQSQTNQATLDRIIDFKVHQQNLKESKVVLRSGTTTLQLYLYQFLRKYHDLTLSFFNSYYFINQITFDFKVTNNNMIKTHFLSCRLKCSSQKNNCYLMFNFGSTPSKKPCRVSIYRCLNDDEAKIVEGMNPLSEERRRYEYVGQIKRFGNFFFETELQCGQFICILEGIFQMKDSNCSPHLMILSQKEIGIFQKDMDFEPIKNNKHNQKSKMKMKVITPKILIETKNKHQHYKPNFMSSKNRSEHNKVKIRRKFIADRDSSTSEKENTKQ